MIPALILTIVAILYRLVLGLAGDHSLPWIHNFSPLAAIALCSAIYLPRRMALSIPFAALFVSDLVLNAHFGASLVDVSMLSRYAALLLVSGLGFWIARAPRLGAILAGSVAGSVIFYLLTNTATWLGMPEYAKTLAGWVQALTVGLPQFKPTTLEFFRNSLVSDLAFTLLFAGCMHWSARRARVQSHVAGAAVRQA